MNKCYKLQDYILIEQDNELFWYQKIDDLVFYGKAFILENISTLLIAPYEEILSQIPNENCEKWEKTDYFALVSETGNVNFFEIKSGEKLNENLEEKLRQKLGCTAKYRNAN